MRAWSPNEHQALGLAASYRKLYPQDCDAWIEGQMPSVGEPDF